MADFEFSAYDMLKERNIKESWVKIVMERPEKKEAKDDETVHYLGSINEFGGRYLPIVVDPRVKPQKIVTLFFDRRVRRTP